jgi:hypothetical protein
MQTGFAVPLVLGPAIGEAGVGLARTIERSYQRPFEEARCNPFSMTLPVIAGHSRSRCLAFTRVARWRYRARRHPPENGEERDP